MKVGIDSYCYHRFFGEVYPDQKPPAKNMTMQDFLTPRQGAGRGWCFAGILLLPNL